MATLSRSWDRASHQNALAQFIDTALRGAGQVMFQNNPLTGLLFLVGIFWAAIAAGSIDIGIGAVLGLLVSTLTAIWLDVDEGTLRQGLYGFNGILVGVALPTFLASSPAMWVFLILGGAVSTVVMLAVAKVMKTFGVPALTFPFVLTTWFLLLTVYQFAHIPNSALGPAELPGTGGIASGQVTADSLVNGWFKGVSQVFLASNAITGIIFVIALAASSRWAALFALIGSAVGLAVALFFGANQHSVTVGLYGFSAVLTGIALGSVFYTPSTKSVLYTLLGIVFTVIVQAAMNTALAPIGIPTLTAPFVLATWLFLLPEEHFAPIAHQQLERRVAGQR